MTDDRRFKLEFGGGRKLCCHSLGSRIKLCQPRTFRENMAKEKKAGVSQQLFLVLFLVTTVIGSWRCAIEYVS